MLPTIGSLLNLLELKILDEVEIELVEAVLTIRFHWSYSDLIRFQDFQEKKVLIFGTFGVKDC